MLQFLPYALAAYGGYRGYRDSKDQGISGINRLLNTAAGVLGSQGSRLIRFDRDFPNILGATTFFGSTNQSFDSFESKHH